MTRSVSEPSEWEVVALTEPSNSNEDDAADAGTNRSRRVKKRRRKRRLKAWQTKLMYSFLATLAIGLTISCKETKLWIHSSSSDSSSERGTLQEKVFYSLMGHYVVVLIAFLWVQNSDPGYITPEVMEWVSKQDGWTLLGDQQNLEMAEEGEKSNGIQSQQFKEQSHR